MHSNAGRNGKTSRRPAIITTLFDPRYRRPSIFDGEPDGVRLEKITSFVDRYTDRYKTALLDIDNLFKVLVPAARTRILRSPFFIIPDPRVNAQVVLIRGEPIVAINGGLLIALRFQT